MFDFLATPELFASFFQMVMRSVIIYVVALIMVRFNRKIMGLRNPFNFLVFIMLGSLSVAGITLEGIFLPVLGLIIFLFIFNASVAYTISHVPALENFVAGPSVVLVKNGHVKWAKLKDYYITRTELRNELKEQLQTNDFSIIETAYLASDGTINFVTKKNKKK